MSSPFVLVFAAGADEVNRQIAIRFAPHHPIAFLAPPSHNLSAAVSAAHIADGEAVLFETDLTSVESIKASVTAASAHFGKQCAAAIFQVRDEPTQVPFLQQTAAQFHAAATTQIASVYAFSQAVLPLLTYGGGSAEFPATLAYIGTAGTSRSDKIVENALIALSRSLGREYGKKYIHVTHVKFNKGPGALESKKQVDGERVAETLWYLYTQPFSCFANELIL